MDHFQFLALRALDFDETDVSKSRQSTAIHNRSRFQRQLHALSLWLLTPINNVACECLCHCMTQPLSSAETRPIPNRQVRSPHPGTSASKQVPFAASLWLRSFVASVPPSLLHYCSMAGHRLRNRTERSYDSHHRLCELALVLPWFGNMTRIFERGRAPTNVASSKLFPTAKVWDSYGMRYSLR